MPSLHGSARSSLLAIAVCIFVASPARGAQPPDVVASDAHQNTAMGSDALLFLAVGGADTAAGYQALYSNTDGFGNTAFGAQALQFNTAGHYNTASGYAALYDNTSGYSNTASGAYALAYNTSGANNTASGDQTLTHNTSGKFNTATGVSAMQYNDTGSNNTAVGVNALGTNRGGSNNIAIGTNAGYYVRGGRYNIEIGNVGGANDAGTIRIGTSSQQGSAFIAGIANSHVTGSAVYVTSTGQLGVLASSERYKTNVTSLGSSTEKLSKLRPVSFRLKSDPRAGVQYGLIAEEVAKVYPELVIRNEAGQAEGVRYEELTPMLLNEVQRQQQEPQELRRQVVELRQLQHKTQH